MLYIYSNLSRSHFNMYNVQLAAKTQLIYCTVYTMYKTTCFGLFWPSSGFSYSLESEVSYRQIYHIDNEISFIFISYYCGGSIR